MTEKFTQFDEALREKLDGYNDVVNDSVFAKLQAKRALQQKLNDASSVVNADSVFAKLQAKRAYQHQLSDAISELPTAALFENIQFKRNIQQKLNNTTTDVPSGMFEDVEYQKALQSKIDSAMPPVRSVLFDRMQGKRVLQNKLNDYESPVSANLFNKIQVARKERKPKFTIYYWAAACVAACLVLWLLSTQIQVGKNIKSDNNTSASNTHSQIQNGNTISKEITIPNTDLKPNTETQKQTQTDNQISDSEGKNNLSKHEVTKNSNNFEQKDNLVTAQKLNSEIKAPSKKLSVLAGHGAISRIERSKTKTSEEQIVRSNDGFAAQSLSTKEEKTILEASKSSKKLIVDSSENTATVIDITKQPDMVSPSEILNSQNLNSQVKGGSKGLGSTSLAAQELNTQLYKRGIKSLKPFSLCGGPGDECPTFAGARLRNYVRPGLFFEPFMGGALIKRTLTETTTDYTAYRQKRDSTESSQYAIQAGLMLGYQFRNGFHASTGIRYERISEKATYDSIGVGQISYVITLTVPPDTSAKVLTDGIFRKTRFNTFTSFEIPIRLGYTMVLNRYWALDLTASAGFNFATTTKQSVYNPEGALVDNTDVSNNYFKKTYGWSGGLSVGVSRALSANTQLVLSAYGNYKVSPVTTTDYVLTQKYGTYGINAAWRYQF